MFFHISDLDAGACQRIYVPDGYDVKKLKISWTGYEPLINHTKYANNYDYNKAVFIVNKDEFIDSGFLLFKRSSDYIIPGGGFVL